jgi:tRNA dimethylallyltransferase
MLSSKDKQMANKITKGNKKRLIRALELLEQNKTLDKCNEEKYDAMVIVCERPRDVLYNKINIRVDEMLEAG